MVTIELYKDTFDNVPERYEHRTAGEWLLDYYGDTLTVPLVIYKNGVDITGNIDELVTTDGHYEVLETPGDPVTVGLIIGGLVLGAVVALLAPDMPELGQNRTSQSPNNRLSSRKNEPRFLQRIEDIYGTVRSIPTLIMPSYTKYVNNQAVEYNYMCIGRGYYDITADDVRDGDTRLSFITGSSAEFYEPFTSPNSGDSAQLSIGDAIAESVITASRSNEIDGALLLAPNQANTLEPDDYSYSFEDVGGTDRDTIIQPSESGPAWGDVFDSGDTVDITMTVYGFSVNNTNISADSTLDRFSSASNAFTGYFTGATITVSGFATPSINGVYTISAVDAGGAYIDVVESVPANESAGATVTITQSTINYTGARTILLVDTNKITLDGTSVFVDGPSDYSSTVEVQGSPEYTDWVVIPDPDRTKVFVNIIAPQGMYKDSGNGKISTEVTFELQVEELDSSLVPTGTVETFTDTVSGATSLERANTLEVTPAFTGECRVRMRRQTDFDFDFSGTVIDEIKWADVYSVTPVTPTDFGDVTTVHTVTRATSRATAIKERQFNCLVTRKLPTYDGTSFSGTIDDTGLHDSGTISATKRFVDIVAAVSTDPEIGGLDLGLTVDIDQIYSAYNSVAAWSTEYGDFSYTFDDNAMSYEETIRSIADACFCKAYRLNSLIRFSFEEAQSTSSALFTHRNKKPNSETLTRSFSNDAEYDGVELVYVDPDSEKQETIKLPDDASKYKKIETVGVREFSTAWVRANRELNKINHQRLIIQTDTTIDGRLLLPDTRIDIVDNTRFKTYDGEVIAKSGLTLTLSKEVAFTSGESHSIILMQRDGSLESIACTAGTESNQVLLDSEPSEAIVADHSQDGIRTIFSFAADSARDAQAYLVKEIRPGDNNYVTVVAVNYSDEYYSQDFATIPDKSTIIN